MYARWESPCDHDGLKVTCGTDAALAAAAREVVFVSAFERRRVTADKSVSTAHATTDQPQGRATDMALKILVLNGPNLNRLGKRRPERYGTATLQDVVDNLNALGAQLGVEILHKQSNYEGELIDCMHDNMDVDGVIVNPAGLTLYGRPLLDAIGDLKKPIAVVHIVQLYKHGDIYGPETNDYWKTIGDVYVCGLGIHGYNAALLRLVELITGKQMRFAISALPD